MDILNDDILGINARLNRYTEEALKSSSSNVSNVSAADMARFSAYLVNITAHVDWIVSEPILDLPETHPLPRPVDAGPEISQVENEHINDLVRLLIRGRDELLNSQSARNATSLIAFDEARFRAVILKCQNLLDHVVDVSPIDLPESTPQVPVSGSGRGGI